ncbi:MAG: 3-methyladenine DNA glycosylase [Bacteroidota bacterium]
MSPAPRTPLRLAEETWRAEATAHQARLDPVLTPYLAQRSAGGKDPVLDFLFEYYHLRPSHLRRWSPGVGVVLEGAAQAFLERPGFIQTPAGVTLDPTAFPARRRTALSWTLGLLRQTAERPAFLGCSGLHEWAMVYRAETVRHNQLPLRLPREALAAFVESRPVVCSHFDAFRFFTPAARPLNKLQPTRAAMPSLEQPGCLHTNMDLYRWALKAYPWIPGTVLIETFLLALRARRLDMQASPYDLRAYGLPPVRIETDAGRRHYRGAQKAIAESAAPIRQRLIKAYERVLQYVAET